MGKTGLIPMDAELLPPSDDRVFKLLLTKPEAKPALINLLSAVLGRGIADAEIYANELPAEDAHEKAERLDINCKLDDGSQVNIEMQASRMPEVLGGGHQNLKGRAVYYAADLHSSQPAKGQPRYDRLARTYQITFCTYTVFPGDASYVNSFSLRNDVTGELLCDAIRIFFVELSKLEDIVKKPVGDMTDLEKWSVFFQYAPDPMYRETVNAIIESEEAIQMAGNLLMSISKDEEERAHYRSRKKYLWDMANDMAIARDVGLEQGREQGLAEGSFNTMAAALRDAMAGFNVSLEQAMAVLKVPEADRPKYREILAQE